MTDDQETHVSHASGKLVIVRDGQRMSIEPPCPEILERLTFDEVSLATRTLPLSYPTSMQIVHKYEITFPSSFEVGYVPDDVRFGGPYADFEASFRLDGSRLEHESTFRRAERIVPSEDYPEFRELLQRISSYAEGKIYFIR